MSKKPLNVNVINSRSIVINGSEITGLKMHPNPMLIIIKIFNILLFVEMYLL